MIDTIVTRQRLSAIFLQREAKRARIGSIEDINGNKLLEDSWIKIDETYFGLGKVDHGQPIGFSCEVIVRDGNLALNRPSDFERIRLSPKVLKNIICPTCKEEMTGESGPKKWSRDHIYPIEWNRIYECFPINDQTNLRLICEDCNRLRGIVNHCIGAMACVRDVASNTGLDHKSIITSWRLNTMRHTALNNIRARIYNQSDVDDRIKQAGIFKEIRGFLTTIESSWRQGKSISSFGYNPKFLGQELYFALLNFGFIEKTANNKFWWMTEKGIEFHSSLWHRDEDTGEIIEEPLYHTMSGFLYGLFNTNNPNLSRVYRDGEVHTAINTKFDETIVDMVADLIDNIEPEQIHGPDLANFCYDIIHEFNSVNSFFYAAHNRHYSDDKGDDIVKDSNPYTMLMTPIRSVLDQCLPYGCKKTRSSQLSMIMTGFLLSMMIDIML